MKKIFLSFLITACTFFTVAAQKEIVNDPNAEVRTLTGSFTSIKISGGIDLFLSQSETPSIAVSASEAKFRDAIKIEVVNGVLKIYYDENNWGNLKNWKNKKLRAYVSFKDLEMLQASGASDVQVAGVITVPDLQLNLGGASDFKGAVKVTDLKMELSGASDVKISGIATTVNISSSGASDVSGFDLTADFCTARASGASDINITVNKELTASASGASDISYKGNAVIKESHSSGASSVGKKG
jgi:hypothetical protein